MIISKLNGLSDKEQKIFYRELTSRLLDVFSQGYYENDEDLQADFHEWKNGDIKDYRLILDGILEDIAPDGIELSWRDVKKLNYKRWHVCRVCNEPFIAIDKQNNSKMCYGQDYIRYKESGEVCKYTEKGYSKCFLMRKAELSINYKAKVK